MMRFGPGRAALSDQEWCILCVGTVPNSYGSSREDIYPLTDEEAQVVGKHAMI
jgi:hypothetical protein